MLQAPRPSQSPRSRVIALKTTESVARSPRLAQVRRPVMQGGSVGVPSPSREQRGMVRCSPRPAPVPPPLLPSRRPPLERQARAPGLALPKPCKDRPPTPPLAPSLRLGPLQRWPSPRQMRGATLSADRQARPPPSLPVKPVTQRPSRLTFRAPNSPRQLDRPNTATGRPRVARAHPLPQLGPQDTWPPTKAQKPLGGPTRP